MRQIFGSVRASFDANERGLQPFPTILRTCWFAITVLSLVWLLKPDLFGLVPNSLDPMFYTGYAINLDDALAAAGNRHYFVTRWTSYMPMYVFSEVFGPYWGRLILRLVMILILAEMFWRIGYRFAFPTRSRLLGIFSVVVAPMFVRAFTTDYPEYLIIWVSIVLCLTVVSFVDQPRHFKSIAIGVFAVSIVIANPFTILLLGTIFGVGFVFAKKAGVEWRWIITTPVLALVSGAVILLLGYFQFKNRYLIGNVYQPTLEFIRGYEQPAQDGWVAPSKTTWLGKFSWLYLSPILVFLVPLLARKAQGLVRKSMYFLGAVSLIVFAVHVYVEIRRGNALETSYYWSMSLGPILALVFVLVGHAAKDTKVGWLVLTYLSLLTLTAFRIPQAVQLPSGRALLATLLLIVISLVVIRLRTSQVFAGTFLCFYFWAQMGAPTYSQRSYGGELNSPRYDLVYRSATIESDLVLKETIWFLRNMDEIDDDWKSTFLSAGGWSAGIVGSYIPHPFSRWIRPEPDQTVLSPNVRDELEFGHRPLLVIFGDPSEVDRLKTAVEDELPRSKVLLDRTHQEALGYRLVVLKGNVSTAGESQIPMARLHREVGRVTRDGSVEVSKLSSQGFVSFGPYFGLGEGSYTATLQYTSMSAENLGYFEVFNDATQKSYKVPLVSNGQGLQDLTIEFDVLAPNETWQLRTVYTGISGATFHKIDLKSTRTE